MVFSTACGLMDYRKGGSPRIFGIIIGICIDYRWAGLD